MNTVRQHLDFLAITVLALVLGLAQTPSLTEVAASHLNERIHTVRSLKLERLIYHLPSTLVSP